MTARCSSGGRFVLLGSVGARLSRRVGAGFHGAGGVVQGRGRVDLLVSRGSEGRGAVRSRPQ